MKQKLAALFVTVALALCALPMAAFAEDTVANDVSTADALTAALADTSKVTTINLAEGATIELTSTLQTNKDGVVINGNGATLDFTGVAKESWAC